VEQDNVTKQWKFVSHQKVFELHGIGRDQIYKTTVPSSERIKILRYLDSDNLNRFSLFGSEDALMDTLAFREIELKS